jgi:hypothetical protein
MPDLLQSTNCMRPWHAALALGTGGSSVWAFLAGTWRGSLRSIISSWLGEAQRSTAQHGATAQHGLVLPSTVLCSTAWCSTAEEGNTALRFADAWTGSQRAASLVQHAATNCFQRTARTLFRKGQIWIRLFPDKPVPHPGGLLFCGPPASACRYHARVDVSPNLLRCRTLSDLRKLLASLHDAGTLADLAASLERNPLSCAAVQPTAEPYSAEASALGAGTTAAARRAGTRSACKLHALWQGPRALQTRAPVRQPCLPVSPPSDTPHIAHLVS